MQFNPTDGEGLMAEGPWDGKEGWIPEVWDWAWLTQDGRGLGLKDGAF